MSADAPRQRVEAPNALPVGTRLGEFELLRVLGVGGFGIVYLALDHALEREVAVKEYMPASLAGRTETLHVSLRSQSDAETFALGLKSFVNEARLLARFDHPSLLKVHRFWEGNGTAYMAMPVMRGRTVKDVRAGMTQPPDEAWLRALLDPLLGAIEKLHGEGVYHRDIAPDNIQIEPDGHPVLLDFGAARRVISDKSQALTAILKPAYAPIEQYAEVGSVRQGPWTDLYALGATLHYLLLNRPPPPATARAVHDEASALTVERLPGCSRNFLDIVNWMLAPRPNDRPQSVAQLREVLSGQRLPPLPPPAALDDYGADETVVLPTSTWHQQPAASAPPPPAAPAAQQPATAPPPSPAAPHIGPPPMATTLPPAAAARAPAPAAPPAAAPRPPAPAAPPLATPRPPPASRAAPAPIPVQRTASKTLPLLLGVGGLVVVVAAAALFWPRQAAVPGPQSQASAALPAPAAGGNTAGPGVAAPAGPASEPSRAGLAGDPAGAVGGSAAITTSAGATPAAASAAESRVATVVLPPAAPTPVPPRALPDAAPRPATRPVPEPARVDPRPATEPSRAAVAATPRAEARPADAASRPTPRPPAAVQRPAPPPVTATAPSAYDAPRPRPDATPGQPAPAPVSQPSVAAAPVEPAKPTGPEAKCSGRNPLSYFVCMERECLRTEVWEHADCRKWRKDAKRD